MKVSALTVMIGNLETTIRGNDKAWSALTDDFAVKTFLKQLNDELKDKLFLAGYYEEAEYIIIGEQKEETNEQIKTSNSQTNTTNRPATDQREASDIEASVT